MKKSEIYRESVRIAVEAIHAAPEDLNPKAREAVVVARLAEPGSPPLDGVATAARIAQVAWHVAELLKTGSPLSAAVKVPKRILDMDKIGFEEDPEGETRSPDPVPGGKRRRIIKGEFPGTHI